MKNLKTKLFGVSVFVLALAASCNRDFDKVVPGSPALVTNITYKKPKVLYIIADGARGTSVRDADIPNMKALTTSAIYTWNSLADANATNATNWADMITGVKKEKHNVLTEDFAANKLSTYKTIFERIKSVKPTTRIAVFATTAAFKNNLTAGNDAPAADALQANDAALKTKMVDFIKTDTASLIVGEFSGIDAAGKTVVPDGYDNEKNPAYKAAIKTFDTQVGEILTAVKSRATYADENWLIIITSNKGGAFTIKPADDDKTVFSNTNVNTFTIIASLGFNQTFIAKPFVGNTWSGSAPRFLGDPEKAVGTTPTHPDSAKYFNMFGNDSTASWSVSVKVKKHKNPSNISRGDYYYQWPGFMGRRANATTTGWGTSGAGAGWDFCLIQNTWRFFIGGGSGGAFPNGYEFKGLDFSGDTWHDLTAVVERKTDGSKYVRVYTDGVLAISNQNYSLANPLRAEFKLDGNFNPNTTNNNPFRIGYTSGEIDGSFGKIDVELRELKIWNVALPDATVKQYACDPTMNQSHPNWDNLLGYWPMNEGSGNKLKSLATLTETITMSGGYKWETFTDLVCSPPASNLGLLVPKNSDLPAQILSWFNISRQAGWELDGKVWIPN